MGLENNAAIATLKGYLNQKWQPKVSVNVNVFTWDNFPRRSGYYPQQRLKDIPLDLNNLSKENTLKLYCSTFTNKEINYSYNKILTCGTPDISITVSFNISVRTELIK